MSVTDEVVLLNAEDVSISRTDGGVLHAIIKQKAYQEVSLHRTFPNSKPDEYISVRTKEEEELGIIADIKKLDPVSEEEAVKELRYRYVIPVVTRVDSVVQEPGLWLLDLKTDRGDVQMLMRNIHEHIHTIDEKSVLITDMEERRVKIMDLTKLDKHSVKELTKVL